MNFFSSLNLNLFKVILIGAFIFFAALGLVLFSRNGGLSNKNSSVGTVIIWGTVSQDHMENVLSALRSGNQDYTGVAYYQKQETSFDTDLAEAIATGNGPDVILISQEQLATEQNKISVIPHSDISERTYISSYLPITELFLAKDGTYGIPFVVDPLVLYYNRTVLTQAGIATPPTSWETITSLAEQLSQTSAGTVAQSTIPFGVYDNVENARAIVSLLLLQAGNPITNVTVSGVRSSLTNEGATTGSVTPAQSAMNFYTQFADPSKSVYTWNRAITSARQAFLAGTLAFYPGFASELPDLIAANPNLDFDMSPIPQPQTGSQKLTYGKAYAFSIPLASKNPTGALAVSHALASAALAGAASQALSMAPATRTSLTPSNSDRYAPVYFPQALIAQGWLSPAPSVTDRIFSTMISSITSGGSQVAQAITLANQALNASF